MNNVQPTTENQSRLRTIRQIVRYLGPGFFVTVGFIDPGNWATNISAGSTFNYDLLWIVVLSAAILVLWQHMAAHLGIVTHKCLAEAVREHSSRPATVLYGTTAMAASVATALAEILGAAIGMEILFGIPVRVGSLIATVFVAAMVWFQRYERAEKLIVGFVSVIGLCYLVELFLVHPDWRAVAVHSVVPTLDSRNILIAMGILGAVVMPHNMYLHSEVIQSRQWEGTSDAETQRLLRYEFLDTLLAMVVGMVINAAMIIVAASVFHRNGIVVTGLAQASETLRPLAGRLASLLFGVALLASGVSSSMTAGMAGGTTFSGYMGRETCFDCRWFRAGMILTLVPAALTIMFIHDTFKALVISQVCLSVQLPFTMLPLFLLTTSRRIMGKYANRPLENVLMVLTGLLIVVLNVLLVYRLFGGRF